MGRARLGLSSPRCQLLCRISLGVGAADPVAYVAVSRARAITFLALFPAARRAPASNPMVARAGLTAAPGCGRLAPPTALGLGAPGRRAVSESRGRSFSRPRPVRRADTPATYVVGGPRSLSVSSARRHEGAVPRPAPGHAVARFIEVSGADGKISTTSAVQAQRHPAARPADLADANGRVPRA